jgi:hypothetical protein
MIGCICQENVPKNRAVSLGGVIRSSTQEIENLSPAPMLEQTDIQLEYRKRRARFQGVPYRGCQLTPAQ